MITEERRRLAQIVVTGVADALEWSEANGDWPESLDDEARETIARWLRRLPYGVWDTRLPEPPEAAK
jgi:hypothetical protein